MEEIHQFGYLIKKFGRDTIIYFPAKIIPGLTIIFFTAIFTRVFKPEFYGQYIIIITTTTIITAIFSQWLLQSILRYRAQYIYYNMEFIFNINLFKILIFISLLLILLYTVLYPFKKILHQYEKFYLVSLLIIVADIWFTVVLTIFQADTKANIFTLYTILNAFFKLGLSLIFVFVIKMDISGLLWGAFLSSFILVTPIIFTLFVAKKSFEESTEKDKQKALFINLFKQFFGYGFPMVGWFIGSELLMVSDRYFLQIFRGSNEVGIYSTNYSLISSAISFITVPLLNAAHPLIMKANVDSSFKLNEIKKLINAFSRYFLLLVYPITTYIVLLKGEFVRIFLGPGYREGSIIFPIIAPGILLWFFAMFGHKGLELREKTNKMFLYVLVCAIMKLILNVFFIPPYGYIGAAITTLICFSLYPVLVYFGTKNDIEWSIPWMTIIKLAVVLIPLIVAVYVIKHFITHYMIVLIVSLFVVVIVYIIMLFIFQEIQPGEIIAAKLFLKRLFKL
ncbi:MAG: polysaccharide biosynthesis C-terminal domain-containing protein [candidate division WOR-3 bacterium]